MAETWDERIGREASEQLASLPASARPQRERPEYVEVGRGWWVISGDALIEALQRANAGEDPETLYIELYANSEVEEA